MTKNEIKKKLIDVAGQIENHEAWSDDELTDSDVELRKEWSRLTSIAKKMGITNDEITKCKARGIFLYEKVWCGISEYE